MSAVQPAVPIADIVANFAYLDDWDDRYRYLIELGRTLQPMPESEHTEVNKVRGCASQVWLATRIEAAAEPGRRVLHFRGDSDAHIVRGLVALILAVYSGHTAAEIASLDAGAVFDQLGLGQHLTPQRSNGVRAMAERIKNEARAAMAAA